MRIGTLTAIRNDPARPVALPGLYHDSLEDIVLAEELGFDFAWFGEHRATVDEFNSTPFLLMASVAARTERLRLGTSILCLPLHNPLRVAEDVAVLDILSGGRIDLGVGIGSLTAEFAMLGIDPKERIGRTWEAVDLIRRCFSDEWGFEHHGRYYDFGPIHLNARPLQDELPIWFGGFGPRNVQRAAARGLHLLAGPAQPLAEHYDASLREAGRDPDAYGIAPMLTVSVAETEAEAFAQIAEPFCASLNFYIDNDTIDVVQSARITPDMVPDLSRRDGVQFQPIVGTPDQVAARLIALRDGAQGRVTQVALGFRLPGMSTDVVRRSMLLFADQVMPRLRD